MRLNTKKRKNKKKKKDKFVNLIYWKYLTPVNLALLCSLSRFFNVH